MHKAARALLNKLKFTFMSDNVVTREEAPSYTTKYSNNSVHPKDRLMYIMVPSSNHIAACLVLVVVSISC